MTEKMLQFIWRNRYYHQQGLSLVTGETLTIDHPGDENKDQGPDFLNARVWIGDCYWIGSVELHLCSSGWFKHNHENDPNYKNVILHVVWTLDHPELNRNIPQLELFSRISFQMLRTYAGWMKNHSSIPCKYSISRIEKEQWESWMPDLVVRRLNRKKQDILFSLEQNNFHWEEQLWWLIAANFGNPVNTAAFEMLAKSIPYAILARHRNHPFQIEALLTGQAGLLEGMYIDMYAAGLKREYHFLKKKYRLRKIHVPVQFFRMRPENFPCIRLSQLAALFSQSTSLFAWILNCESIEILLLRFSVRAAEYWNTHYVFEKNSIFQEKLLGNTTRNNLVINSIIPLLYTYGKSLPDQEILEKSLSWLKRLPAEQNKITNEWKKMGVPIKKAHGSQALIELKKKYCDQYSCLDCEIGKRLLAPISISK